MRVTIQFELPQDEDEFEDCIRAQDYKFVLYDLNEWLRRFVKHGMDESGTELSAEALDIYDRVQTKLWDFSQDRNVQPC